MLREYLPTLPACLPDRSKAIIPASVLKTLEKGVTLRNESVHRGSDIEKDRLREILLAVRDLLRLLDYYSGCPWALRFVRVEMRGELETGSKG
jgi:hypothetical protein